MSDESGIGSVELTEPLREQEAEQERAALLALVQHDLATPLAVVQGWLETLHTDGDDLTAEERALGLTVARRNVQEIATIVEALFAEVRADAMSRAGGRGPTRLGDALRPLRIADGVEISGDSSCEVAGPPTMVEPLARSVIRALGVHRPAGSTVAWQAEGDEVVVDVRVPSARDTGELHPDIEAANATASRLFLRAAESLVHGLGGSLATDEQARTARVRLPGPEPGA